jgi:hypothetical protein
LQLVERRLRAHLETAPGAALALVEIEATESATVAIAALARSLAAEGNRVVLADSARGRPLAALLGAGEGAAGTVRTVSINEQQVDLFVAPDDPAQMTDKEAGEDADAILVLATVDPSLGADHIAAWASDAVVMVQAGAASATRIAGIGQQLRAARMTIRSALLIGTDAEDESSGYPFPFLDDPTDRLFETLKAAGT